MNRPAHDPPHRQRDDEHPFPLHFVPRMQAGHYTPFYLAPGGHVYLSYLEHCLARLAVRDWDSLIDIGCGHGRLVAMLHERFPNRTIVGVDPSEHVIALARGLVPHAYFRSGDIATPGLFDQKFDVATCIETLATIEPARLPQFVAAVRGLLNDGGTLAVTVPSTKARVPADHRQHFTSASLGAALAAHFRAERIEHLNWQSFWLRFGETLLFNRFYIVSHKQALHWFYRHYRRFHTVTSERRGQRILGIFRAI
jgi:cyclopropane fatty-acyl-phospholipid synthase-like methyltransferase